MTTAEFQSMLEADYLGFDALENLTYVNMATGGGGVYTVGNARKTFQETKAFGEPQVKGYAIETAKVTFPVDSYAFIPKAGDTFTLGSNTHEVTEVEYKTAFTRWNLTGERAFIETDWAASIDIQRATLSVNSAGAQGETYADTTAGVSCIVASNDDVADMISRLGVRGDKQSLNFYVAQTVTVAPTDRIEYNSRFYRITSIQDENKVSRLKRIVAEIYA